jgi:hypothetical protein
MLRVRSQFIFIVILVVSVACISACATNKTQQMLNSRMQLMNYEEALQRFGPPTQCAEAGSTKTCTWIYGSGGTVFMPVGRNVFALPTDAPSARLTFTNNVLTYWQLTGNWE